MISHCYLRNINPLLIAILCCFQNVYSQENRTISDHPDITKFTPECGPWEGGTNITIEFVNFDLVSQNVTSIKIVYEVSGQTIANCLPFEDVNYINNSQILCQIKSPINTPMNASRSSIIATGPIVVEFQDGNVASSATKFAFVVPRITYVFPSKGPISGGTLLRIWGLHMDAGNRVEAFVNGLECEITGRNKTCVECITSPSTHLARGVVTVNFDNGVSVFDDYYDYMYTDDPIINQVESGSFGQQDPPKGILSGGINISVQGNNLNSVQEPMIYILVDGQEYARPCEVQSSTKMKCTSPSVPTSKIEFHGKEEIKLEFGFIMDNVESVRNLSGRPGYPKFYMYPDPLYYNFTDENETKSYTSGYLTIYGENLDRASQEEDIIVKIGESFCQLTSLSRSQLTCRPPASQPPGKDSNGVLDHDILPTVVVEVGDKLQFTIGKLKYKFLLSHDSV